MNDLNFCSELTIAIPVYERMDYFIEALESALNQSVQCAVIVVDNDSSHNEFEKIVLSYKDKNLKYFRNPTNVGMLGNWNRCIELCETSLLTILHDDDILHPLFVKSINETELDWNVLFTRSKVGPEPNNFTEKDLGKSVIKLHTVGVNSFAFGNFNQVPGTVFRKETAVLIGGFKDDFGYILDFHFWLELCKVGRAYFLDVELSFYRISAVQGTKSLYKNMLLNTYRIMNSVPVYRRSLIVKNLTNFKIFTEGMHMYSDNGTKEIIMEEISDNEFFLKDIVKYRWIFDIALLRKFLIYVIQKLMSINQSYNLFKLVKDK